MALPARTVQDPGAQLNFESLDKSVGTLTTALGAAVPVGTIITFALAVAPAGWQLCNGAVGATAAILAALDAAGRPFGGGAGAGLVPNLAGRVGVGVGTATGGGVTGATAHALGQVAGEETHVLSLAESPAHSHGARTAGQGLVQGGYSGANLTAGGGQFGHDGSAQQTDNKGGGGAHQNMQPYVGLNFLIKV